MKGRPKLRDRRPAPRPGSLVIFGGVAFVSAYWLAYLVFAYPVSREYMARNEPLGGDFSWGLLVLFLTGWIFATLARMSFKIRFWACGGRAVFTSVCGVGATIAVIHLITVWEGHADSRPDLTFFGSLVFMFLAFVFSPVTILGVMVGYGTVEGFGRLLVQQDPRPPPSPKRVELLAFFDLPPHDRW